MRTGLQVQGAFDHSVAAVIHVQVDPAAVQGADNRAGPIGLLREVQKIVGFVTGHDGAGIAKSFGRGHLDFQCGIHEIVKNSVHAQLAQSGGDVDGGVISQRNR